MVTLLGFKDEEINEACSWDVNKIGGNPDWMPSISTKEHPRCEFCAHTLYHILQIYCPLVGSDYHRTLNVFACVERNCCKEHGNSLIVLRSQWKQEHETKTDCLVTNKSISEDDWGMNDWVTESNESIANNEANENNISSSCIVSTTSIPPRNFDNEIADSFHSKLSISNDIFRSYYVYASPETDFISTISTEREMDLYRTYVEKEGELSATMTSNSSKEKYEKTVKTHGDTNFHTFKKTVSYAANQVLRYEWNGRPLIYSSISKPSTDFASIPSCCYCNSPRVFELQLMPHLASILNENFQSSVKLSNDLVVNFECVYIYSCAAACWESDATKPREEFYIIHLDPDDIILNDKKYLECNNDESISSK